MLLQVLPPDASVYQSVLKRVMDEATLDADYSPGCSFDDSLVAVDVDPAITSVVDDTQHA